MAKKTAARERECLTMSVPEAGWHYWGEGRNGSYALAKERPDLLPTVTVRGKKRVPVPLMDQIILSVGKDA